MRVQFKKSKRIKSEPKVNLEVLKENGFKQDYTIYVRNKYEVQRDEAEVDR